MATERGSLMRSLDDAVRQGRPSQLSIEGSGTVSVYPRQFCYVTDIQDWETVYAVGSERIHVHPTAWGTPPDTALPLEELRWRAAYHDHWPAPPDQPALGHDLVALNTWPNLPRLPEELLAPVARVCALLWRKPTVGYLIPRVLQLPAHQAFTLLKVLQAFGHVTAPGLSVAPGMEATPARPPHEGARGESGLPAGDDWQAANTLQLDAGSFIGKLWQRLTRLQAA